MSGAPGRRGRRFLIRGVLAAAVVVVLVVFARIEHTHALLLPMILLVCTVVAFGGMLVDGAGFDSPDWGVPASGGGVSAGQDGGLLGNIRVIENHLSARQTDTLLPGRLARLAEDRLRRLGLDRDDPGVRERLGPTLSPLLDGQRRALAPAEIEECIRRIEELR